MLINEKHDAVQRLRSQWANYKETDPQLRLRRSKELQRELRRIIEEALRPFRGELMLTYEKFLTRRPSGTHSFAHGVEMRSDDVHWVTVAVIQEAKLLYVKAHSRLMGSEGRRMRIGSSPKFLVPVSNALSLQTVYRNGSNTPSFIIREKEVSGGPNEHKCDVDVAMLGKHLFRLRPGYCDWYRQTEIVFGNASVEEWLQGHNSADTFASLLHS